MFGRKKEAATRDKLAVARLLAERGPLPGCTAADLLGWTTEHWWTVVGTCNDFFDLTGKGWKLTPAGREAVEAATAPVAG